MGQSCCQNTKPNIEDTDIMNAPQTDGAAMKDMKEPGLSKKRSSVTYSADAAAPAPAKRSQVRKPTGFAFKSMVPDVSDDEEDDEKDE
mmetsp:Transcript_145792/g.254359  ORF Transcript_145792/g.254359 Transcript_145792/m.254359 type:complete len:88 (+) Transcript_145792:158-421(+)